MRSLVGNGTDTGYFEAARVPRHLAWIGDPGRKVLAAVCAVDWTVEESNMEAEQRAARYAATAQTVHEVETGLDERLCTPASS